MRGRYVVGFGLVVGMLSGCTGSDYPLPDRNTAEVQAEEQRLAVLLPDRLLGGPGTCKVRLLGRDGSASYAWAHCESPPTGGVVSAVSVPVRVDGDAVRQPDDGAGYAASVERMFPSRLAEAVLDQPDRLRP